MFNNTRLFFFKIENENLPVLFSLNDVKFEIEIQESFLL